VDGLIEEVAQLLRDMTRDLEKFNRGFEVAGQRLRVDTLKFVKLSKRFREESVKSSVMSELKRKREEITVN
jgi:hypothetical protein